VERKFRLHPLIHTFPLESSAQNVEKKKAEPKTPHFLSLNQDIVAWSQQEECALKYVMLSLGGQSGLQILRKKAEPKLRSVLQRHPGPHIDRSHLQSCSILVDNYNGVILLCNCHCRFQTQ
jgi:hypothetical protein